MTAEHAASRDPGALGLWVRNLLCLLIPAGTLTHLATGPHGGWGFLASLVALVGVDALERIPWVARNTPPPNLPRAPFTAVLYVLVVLQFASVSLFCVRLERVEPSWLGAFDMLLGLAWCATASSSAIVLAHELVHRPRRLPFQLSRLVLCTVLYEHFATEHVRGHHVRVGTPADPATARYGERFWPFLRRTVPGQFRSAWRLERDRLQLDGVTVAHPRWLRHRVLQGLLFEGALLVAIGMQFGALAVVGFVLQAILAVMSLEAVNYFEHWGLVRTTPKVEPWHSWDCDAWFTQYALVGLSRHADHHRRASTPYERLELLEGAPMLPAGYGVMLEMAVFQNAKFQRMLTEELERRGLAPSGGSGA